MVLSLPLTVYGLYFMCPSKDHCTILEIPPLPTLDSLFTTTAAQVFLVWFAFQALLYILLPGEVCEGLPIARLQNKRLKYKCNGKIAKRMSIVDRFSFFFFFFPLCKFFVDS